MIKQPRAQEAPSPKWAKTKEINRGHQYRIRLVVTPLCSQINLIDKDVKTVHFLRLFNRWAQRSGHGTQAPCDEDVTGIENRKGEAYCYSALASLCNRASNII